MGYFSELDLQNREYNNDTTYPSFESQLSCRLDDLYDRFDRLVSKNAPYASDNYYSDNDYRYSPVECFDSVADISRAIEIAKADLRDKCGISVDNKTEDEDPYQLTIFEYPFLLAGMIAQAAA